MRPVNAKVGTVSGAADCLRQALERAIFDIFGYYSTPRQRRLFQALRMAYARLNGV